MQLNGCCKRLLQRTRTNWHLQQTVACNVAGCCVQQNNSNPLNILAFLPEGSATGRYSYLPCCTQLFPMAATLQHPG